MHEPYASGAPERRTAATATTSSSVLDRVWRFALPSTVVGVNPVRHRQQLIRGLDDDGLEELTLRYVRPDHPDAHRTRRGTDGGIDVLSDYERPPKQGWQCKTSINAEPDWGACRRSIKSAMENPDPPDHYTFVFNFALTVGQRNTWRETFLPELQRAYPQLSTIDYIDDLDRKIEERDDLIDWLEDGAYGVYVRRTLQRTAATGVNPIANAVDLTDGLPAVAEHASQIGKTDPRFAYGVAGREAGGQDQGLVDRVAHFSMTAGQREGLPTFTVTVRDGGTVTELSAKPRAGVDVDPPQPWFASSDDGIRARATARTELAKGRPVSIAGRHVGIAGGHVPDRFTEWMDPERPLGRGQLELGLSEPLELTITMAPPEIGLVREPVTMYRVPPEPGAELAYAGAIGAAVIAIDVAPGPPPPGQQNVDGERWVNCSFTVTLAVEDESAQMALRGLGFAEAFGAVDHLHFACPGLLPPDGYDIHGQLPLGDGAAETWEVAATLALALQALTDRDGVVRTLPAGLGPRDLARAEMVLHLVGDGCVEVTTDDQLFPVPLPPDAKLTDDPQQWMTFTAELPPLVSHRTGLIVEQEVRNAEAVSIEPNDRGTLALICSSGPGGATIVMRLAESTTSA